MRNQQEAYTDMVNEQSLAYFGFMTFMDLMITNHKYLDKDEIAKAIKRARDRAELAEHKYDEFKAVPVS